LQGFQFRHITQNPEFGDQALSDRIEMEEDESRGADEPVAKVSWRRTILWMLGMILLFNLIAFAIFWFWIKPRLGW
jgi:hypothetical protein